MQSLSDSLARHGIVSTAGALAAALASQPMVAAPAELAVQVAGNSLAVAAVGGGGAGTAAWLFMSMTKPMVATLSAVVLLGLGALVGGQWEARARREAAEDRRSRAEAADAVTLRDENRRLQAEVAQLRAKEASSRAAVELSIRSGDANPAAAKTWRVLADLQKQKLMDARMTFLKGSGELDDAFVRLFDLTPAEREALQRGVAGVREKLEALERQNATVARTADGNVVIAVKAFPEACGGLYDELLNQFAQTLGTERQGAFLTLGADQVEKVFGRFGAVQRTVTVTSDPASTHSRYLARDEQIAPGEHSSSSSNYGSRDDLLNRVGTITNLLPPDF